MGGSPTPIVSWLCICPSCAAHAFSRASPLCDPPLFLHSQLPLDAEPWGRPPLPPCVSLCQQAAWTLAGVTSILPPSWNPTGPVAILSLSFMIFLALLSTILMPKVPVGILPPRRISNLFMGHSIRNLFISVPSQIPSHGTVFLLFPSLKGLLWSIFNKVSDASSAL